MSQFDLVVRAGSVLDGTGSEPYTADIGVKDGDHSRDRAYQL